MLLAIYVNDHLAGATAGRDLARRTATSNADSAYGPFLVRLAREVDEDRQTLIAIIRALGVRIDPLKIGSGWAAEKVARLKPNGRLRSYSPLSRVVELEALTLGVHGKLTGWQTLQQLELPALASFDLVGLQQRAADQLQQLEEHHRRATADAFR